MPVHVFCESVTHQTFASLQEWIDQTRKGDAARDHDADDESKDIKIPSVNPEDDQGKVGCRKRKRDTADGPQENMPWFPRCAECSWAKFCCKNKDMTDE